MQAPKGNKSWDIFSVFLFMIFPGYLANVTVMVLQWPEGRQGIF